MLIASLGIPPWHAAPLHAARIGTFNTSQAAGIVVSTRENDMTTRRTTRTSKPRIHLLMLMIMIIGSVAPIALSGGAPVAAQPLCLEGKVWSEEAQACVDLVEAQPVEDLPLQEPQPTEVPAPTEAIVPTEIPAEVEEPQPVEAPAPTEASDATETPGGDSDLRSGGLSTLSMFQWACPAGFDPRTADQATLWATCFPETAEVVYSLTVDGTVFGSAISPTMPASFSNVPPGDFTISQSAPPGYTGAAVLWCHRYGYSPQMLLPDGNDGGSFVLQDVQPDTAWWCDSYLVPVTTGGITAYVFDCPAGFNIYAQEPEDLKANCAPYLRNIQFELEYSDLVSASSTNTLGRTTYSDVPPGAYRLRVRMPDNYGLPVVFCQVRGPDGQTLENYDRFDVSNTASIGLGMDALESVACDFFMAPGGQAYEDPGFPPQGLVPGDNATPVEGEAGLQDPGFPVQGSSGQLVQDANAPGSHNEDSLGTPEAGGEEDAQLVTPDAGSTEDVRGVAAVEGIEGIELPDDSPGKVTILTHECPESFDAYNATAQEINLHCPYPQQSVFEFSLVDGAGTLVLQHTAIKEPYLEFTQVVPGTISIRVSAPDGFGEPIVYCQVVGAPGETPTPYERYPLAAPNTLQHALGPSDRLACDWFNVPIGSLFDDVQNVDVQEVLPVDPITDDSGEDAPSATPQPVSRR
jgi:hypothetical protein